MLRKLYCVPARLRIIAGEVAHHLRSALDLLAYQLLVQAGISDPKLLRECAFPIITNRDLSNPDDRKKHEASLNVKIGGVSTKAHDSIVALQHCATNGEWSHLSQIQELDNTDNHRLLLAGAARGTMFHRMVCRMPAISFPDLHRFVCIVKQLRSPEGNA